MTLLRIPPHPLQQVILQDPPFRRFVFEMYGARLTEVMEVIEEVAFRKLDTRLARPLVQRGPVVSAVRQNVADELGSVLAFVRRMLRDFEERGSVRLKRERIEVLDVQALQEFSRLWAARIRHFGNQRRPAAIAAAEDRLRAARYGLAEFARFVQARREAGVGRRKAVQAELRGVQPELARHLVDGALDHEVVRRGAEQSPLADMDRRFGIAPKSTRLRAAA